MTPRRKAYLAEIGITPWVARDRAVAAGAAGEAASARRGAAVTGAERPGAEAPPAGAIPEAEIARLDWAGLAAAVQACTRCRLHATRRQAVLGTGNHEADLLVVGEAPGAEEDRQGEPFVGRAGQLLNAMLRAIGLSRETVYIANILKCRPPNNRDPKPDESAACAPFLNRQIELLQPRAVLALGRISGQWLLQSDLPVGRLRGRVVTLAPWNLPLVVSYHPAYLLRTPAAKAKAWQDLLLVRELLKRDA